MIGVDEAQQLMMEQVTLLPTTTTGLLTAHGRFLAADVVAPNEHPLFDCSAVDGYALSGEPSEGHWHIIGEIAAGGVLPTKLEPGQCARIFTGAQVPEGTTAVVMQEFVARTQDGVTHNDTRLRSGANIRKRGEQLQRGEVILRTGERLNAAAVGMLASVGVDHVRTTTVPGIGVLITGDEFITSENSGAGRIYSSNDVMLGALLAQTGISASPVHVADALDVLERGIRSALDVNDVVISTGGASVGDHDLVRVAVERCGGRIIFHGVAQKPGKPMLFARFGNKVFFGLPGNPRAVLVLYHAYVLPYLEAMQHAGDPWWRTEQLPLEEALTVKGDRAEFRAALVVAGQVRVLRDEGSHMLRSMVEANALAYLPADRREWKAGDPIRIHHLPQ